MCPSEAPQELGYSEDLEDIEIVKKLLELKSHLRDKTNSLESERD